MSVLVIAEHGNSDLKAATRNAVTAAAKIEADIHVLVCGHNCRPAAEMAAKVAGVTKVLVADDPAYEHHLAENVAAFIAAVAAGYGHVLATATANGKNIMPRVAALLDVAQISEITDILSPDTFIRPIYAGNALATVQSGDAKKIITVRATAFTSP